MLMQIENKLVDVFLKEDVDVDQINREVTEDIRRGYTSGYIYNSNDALLDVAKNVGNWYEVE